MPRYTDAQREEAAQLLAERDRREATRQRILGELFDIQRNIANRWLAGLRWLALCCSRRAGKTQLLARLIAISLIDSGHQEWTVFCALTLGIAKNIVWDELVRINKRHNLDWRMNEQEGWIKTPTGAQFRLVGVSDKKSVDKVRGNKYRLVICDEAATYQERLQRLLNDAFRAGLADLRGSVILSGTPGYVCAGFWFEAATGKSQYEVFGWTGADNPHMADWAAELDSVLAENKWTDEEPSFKREWLGIWVNDESTLVFAGYLKTRNRDEAEFDADRWVCTLGVDYGMNDATAFTVIGTPKGEDKAYALHCSKHTGLLPDEVSELMAKLVREFKPHSAVGDSGGLGKTFVEEWNRRHAIDAGIALKPAEKKNKLGSIELVNGAFRSGRLFVTEGATELEDELQFLPWYDSQKTKEHPSYPNHASDSLLYAYREHNGYAYVKQPDAPVPPHRKWSTVDERKAKNRKKQSRQWWQQ